MLISIVTVNLNNAHGLRATLLSVEKQNFDKSEHLVIDGGSTDGSLAVIEEYSHLIEYWVSESDDGIYQAMNKGVRRARGEYVLFLNSGDTFNRATVLQEVFGAPRSADIVYGDIDYVYPSGRKRYRSLYGEKLTMAHFFTDTIAHPAAFIRRTMLLQNPFDERLRIVADNKFFYQQVVFNNCTVDYIPVVVADFDTSGISSQRENWLKTHQEREMVLRQMLPPRIYADYEQYTRVLHSPLLPFVLLLRKTTGFEILVARIVAVLVRIYRWFRPLK